MIDTGFILQGLNGMLSPVALWALFIFSRYMYYNRHLSYTELRPAIAMMAFCAAESMLRLPVFVFRVLANLGYDTTRAMNLSYIYGGVAVLIAFLCIIRVFSPNRWGNWSWITPFLCSMVVTFSTLAYVYWR